MNKSIAGVILAGGAATRFNGQIKARLKVDGVYIIERILNAIDGLFDEIIIVTNTPEEFSEFVNCRIIGDEILNAGPLGGIHTAMKASACDAVFVFAGDMPCLDRDLIISQIKLFLAEECKILLPETDGQDEPLHAIYSSDLVPDLEQFITKKKNQSVGQFITNYKIQRLHLKNSAENKSAFTNINTPADLEDTAGH